MVKRWRGTIATVAAAVAIALLVGGCSMDRSGGKHQAAANGQDLAEAKAQLAGRSGITETDIVVDETYSGFTKKRVLIVEWSLADESHVPSAIDEMAKIGWSVNATRPQTGILVRLRLTPQPVIGKIAREHGWPAATYTAGPDALNQLVSLPNDELEQHFGQWPGSGAGS